MVILTPNIYYNMDCFPEVVSDLVECDINRVLLMTNIAVKSKTKHVLSTLVASDIKVEILVIRESDANVLTTALSQMKAFCPDCIIGLGGGHCMDIIKVLRVLYEDPGTILRSLAVGTTINNKNIAWKKAQLHRKGTLIKKLICIPTTCGSGSEATSTAILRNDEGRHVIVSGIAFLPDISIVDCSYIVGIPKFIASITGIRALLHCLEAHISAMASDYSRSMSIQAAKILFTKLVPSIKSQSIPLLNDIHKAASIAGLAIGATDFGLGTVLTRSFSEIFGLPHGLIDGIVIKHVLIFNANRDLQTRRYLCHIIKCLGLSNTRDDEDSYSDIFILLDLLDNILKNLLFPYSAKSIPQSILEYSKYGWFESNKEQNRESSCKSCLNEAIVPEEHFLRDIPLFAKSSIVSNIEESIFRKNLDRMVQRALNDAAILTNPVTIQQSDIIELLENIWEGKCEDLQF
ncbi:alcohol iron-containing family protein [Cryptosporidium andersoni]|uniref:Alcohol iron-containing family protein n=1 Tax=Cryptosporidium andersoni TaxID=117008 RepID=A0A1J4MTX9_9CRYT|nr:alcohol iron-containing family protein [Cryptosporidium andersoni]